MPAQNPRKTCAKLPGEFADIEVWNCFRPDDFGVILLVVFGHALTGMSGDFLPVLSGFLIQVQRQRPNFMEARHFLFFPSLIATRRLPSLFKGTGQISFFDLCPVFLRQCLFLLFAVRSAVDQVRRDDVIPAPADDRLELVGHFEPDPRRITGLGCLLLYHIQTAFPNTIESHVEDVGSTLRSDQRQVDCVLQPRRRLLSDGFQAFNGMPLALLLLDPVDGAARWVVRAQALSRCVVEDVDQQGAALVGSAAA